MRFPSNPEPNSTCRDGSVRRKLVARDIRFSKSRLRAFLSRAEPSRVASSPRELSIPKHITATSYAEVDTISSVSTFDKQTSNKHQVRTAANMSIVTTTQNTSIETEALQLPENGSLVADWQVDLARDGFAVIKGAVSAERAAAYADRLYAYLEG